MPWLYKTKITGLRECGRLICGRVHNSRACLLVKGLTVKALPKDCLHDQVTAKFWYKDKKGAMREVVVASAYLPYESNFYVILIKFCEAKRWDLLLECDAHAHHLTSLGAKLKSFPGRYNNQLEPDHCGEVLNNNIVSAFEKNCRLRLKPVQKRARWWNPTVETLKKKPRRLYSRSKERNNPADREIFRAQKGYKKEIERA